MIQQVTPKREATARIFWREEGRLANLSQLHSAGNEGGRGSLSCLVWSQLTHEGQSYGSRVRDATCHIDATQQQHCHVSLYQLVLPAISNNTARRIHCYTKKHHTYPRVLRKNKIREVLKRLVVKSENI